MFRTSGQYFLLWFFALMCLKLNGQGAYFKSWVVPDTATQNEKVKLILETNRPIKNFQAPKASNFTYVSGPAQNTQRQYVNGEFSHKETYSYYIKFNEIGNYTIGEGKGQIDGEPFKTKPINIHVLPEGQYDFTHRADTSSFFDSKQVSITYHANQLTCDLGDSIQLELHFDSKYQLSQIIEVNPPHFDGFFTKDHEIKPKVNSINDLESNHHSGLLYRWTLYPLKPGKLTIPPCEMKFKVKLNNEKQSFFSPGETVICRSDTLFTSILNSGTALSKVIAEYQNILNQPAKKEIKESANVPSVAFAIDVSGSMKAQDFSPDRLTASGNVIKPFVTAFENEACLVRFAKEAEVLCRAGADQAVFNEHLDSMANHNIPDGTAMGDAIMTSIKTLSNSQTKKHIVLVTDGNSNAGQISGLTASEIAAKLGVKMHMVCILSSEPVSIPYKSFFGTQTVHHVDLTIETEPLKKMTDLTGGSFYVVEDTEDMEGALNNILSSIKE